MTQSQKLLKDFVASQSEGAFRELVARYIDLVYSAAFRLTDGDKHLAEDVAQTVFVDLARMARRLPQDIMLGGWLHRHACYVTATVMRSERRRLTRERKATEMNSIQDHTEANLAQVTPILDEAIDQLGAEDRTAILLRFFDQCDFRSVGEALGSSEDAARKRVSRALEKLYALLQQRGVTFSAGALGTALVTGAVTAAPAGLAVTITSVALSSAAVSTVTTANFFKFVIMTKAKTGILVGVLIAGMATPILMERQTRRRLVDENTLLRQRIQQMALLNDEARRITNVAPRTIDSSLPDERLNELLRLRGQVGLLQRELSAKINNTIGIKVIEPGTEVGFKPKLPPEEVRQILTLDSLKDAGLSSPEAAVQTYLWTGREAMSTNSWESINERYKQLVWTPPGARFAGYAKDAKTNPLRDYKFLKIEAVTYPTSDTATVLVDGYEDNQGYRQGTTYRLVRNGEFWKVDLGLQGQ